MVPYALTSIGFKSNLLAPAPPVVPNLICLPTLNPPAVPVPVPELNTATLTKLLVLTSNESGVTVLVTTALPT